MKATTKRLFFQNQENQKQTLIAVEMKYFCQMVCDFVPSCHEAEGGPKVFMPHLKESVKNEKIIRALGTFPAENVVPQVDIFCRVFAH